MSKRQTLQEAIDSAILSESEADAIRRQVRREIRSRVTWSKRIDNIFDELPYRAYVGEGNGWTVDMEWLMEAVNNLGQYDTSKALSNPVIPSKPVVKEVSRLTTDRNDPRLTHGVDSEPVPQAEAYLVLSEAEFAKGFVRPVRKTYIHTHCKTSTSMGITIAETYARDPQFYGSTYCVKCSKHLPVAEFVWEDGSVVGS